MAIFHRLSADEIRANFTHIGMIYDCVPVYIRDPYSASPVIQVRNWWPEWLLDVALLMSDACAWLCSINDPEWEHPGFRLKLTGEILDAKGVKEPRNWR